MKGWLQITSDRIDDREASDFLRDVLRILKALSTATSTNVDAVDAEDQVAAAFQRALSIKDADVRSWASAASGVLSDLAQQGWTLKFSRQHLWGVRPASGLTRVALRQRLLVRRDEQLSKTSVREFVKDMERWRPFHGRRVSIVSLLRDGRDLAASLRQGVPVADLIDPYIQFVSADLRCELTGLKVQDIWRYFRHTWSSPYESVPGRSLQFLVRDRSTPFHTVIGIAALSSAAVRLGPRDRFIGWDTDITVERLLSGHYPDYRTWVKRVIEGAVAEIYKVDLIRDDLLPADPAKWTLEVAEGLARAAASSRAQHHHLMEAREYKAQDRMDEDTFAAKAELPLFRAKRALELSRLISMIVQLRIGDTSGSEERDLLAKVVRIARTKTVGTEIADLTVCGAIAPYSHLGAGKLVAMLAVSPEVVAEYGRRYKNSPGIIASAMAGRPIGRRANLCYVGTTSLYGIRPNQYDRLAMPVNPDIEPKGQSLRFDFIRDPPTDSRTQGIGTFQFSSETFRGLERFVSSGKGGWRANNVFGEGTSPKLRGLRDGLSAIGFNADLLLVHGMERSMYGVKLATNVDRYLLGFDECPQWVLSPDVPAAHSIGTWWKTRWAFARASRPDVLSSITKEGLAHPIRHSGRVRLPDRDGGQGQIV